MDDRFASIGKAEKAHTEAATALRESKTNDQSNADKIRVFDDTKKNLDEARADGGVFNHYKELTEQHNISKPAAALRAGAHGAMQAGRFTAAQGLKLALLAAANPKIATTLAIGGLLAGGTALYEGGKEEQKNTVNAQIAQGAGIPQG